MIWMSSLEFRTLKLIWSFTEAVHGQSPRGPQHTLHSSQSYLCPASKGPVRTCCCLVTKSLSCAQLFVTPQTVTHQAPLSLGFPRQRCWHGLPFSSSGDIHSTGIKPVSFALAGGFFATEPPGKSKHIDILFLMPASKIYTQLLCLLPPQII